MMITYLILQKQLYIFHFHSLTKNKAKYIIWIKIKLKYALKNIYAIMKLYRKKKLLKYNSHISGKLISRMLLELKILKMFQIQMILKWKKLIFIKLFIKLRLKI
jgi:hypothetical protein